MDEGKCQQCGTPALPGAKYCESCGAKLTLKAHHKPPQDAPQPQPPAPPSAPAPTFQAPNASGFAISGRRDSLCRDLIDTIIIAIISGILTFPLQTPIVTVTVMEGTPSFASTPNPLAWLSGGISLLIFLLYLISPRRGVRPDGWQDGRQNQSGAG